MDICVFSSFALLWIKLLWTFLYIYFYRRMSLFLLVYSSDENCWSRYKQSRYKPTFIRKWKTFVKVIMTFPQQCTRIPVFHFLFNVWCTPSQGFYTSCTFCQLHSSLWIVHSQTFKRLKRKTFKSLKVFFSEQPSFFVKLKIALRAPPYHLPTTLCPLLL